MRGRALRALSTLVATAVLSPFVPVGRGQPRPEPASVAGWVVNIATGKPVERATVVLASLSGTSSQSGLTNAEGAFFFASVEPGRYLLRAIRSGFGVVTSARAQGLAGSVNVTATPGQNIAGVKLRLTPEAIIYGRVTDEAGEALPGVSVGLMTPSYVNGERRLRRIETIVATTDDRGMYRLYDLPAGRYAVVAVGANDGPASDRAFPSYYPSGTDPAKAVLFDMKPGAQLGDINLTLGQATLTKIRGQVVDAATNRPAARAVITFAPRSSTALRSSISSLTADAKGEWEKGDLNAGRWVVTAELARGSERLAARAVVEVPPSGLSDLRLALVPAAEITGTVQLEGEGNRAEYDPAKLTVQLMSDQLETDVALVTVTPQGSFRFRGLRPAKYDATLPDRPEGLYLKSVKFDKQETIDTGFEIAAPGSYRLDFTLGADGAQVGGVVTGADEKPVAGGTVLLAPDPALPSAQRLYRSARTAHNGRFDIKGIPPGRYALYAWEEVEPGIWFEPEFLPPFASSALRIALEPGQKVTADMKVMAPGESAK